VPIKIVLRRRVLRKMATRHMKMEAAGHSETTKRISKHTASHPKTGVMQSYRPRGANNLTACRPQNGQTAVPVRGTAVEVQVHAFLISAPGVHNFQYIYEPPAYGGALHAQAALLPGTELQPSGHWRTGSELNTCLLDVRGERGGTLPAVQHQQCAVRGERNTACGAAPTVCCPFPDIKL
jgi:hypothetical protein